MTPAPQNNSAYRMSYQIQNTQQNNNNLHSLNIVHNNFLQKNQNILEKNSGQADRNFTNLNMKPFSNLTGKDIWDSAKISNNSKANNKRYEIAPTNIQNQTNSAVKSTPDASSRIQGNEIYIIFISQ